VGAVLQRGERRRRAGRVEVEDDGALPFSRGQGGGRQPVVKVEEWLALIGTKRLTLSWCFTP
jgi:hypothetical protein